ncbi:3-hydroxyisobutyryl-CoA hydrolase [Cryobacterium roopkundense]|uniref:3-hydroxyisobutyryl-CoA hydrolase n=1 Tax=Cryobacterium roopkundense TaxID=1001240 RepID=A0A099J389_9MICO|nr:enoyl-CoA hydratase/isomerase family protein [Cryobacterium roopkundense]KGJ72781.1 3-hydroxyisobutyryl-CoA hydrolase [Cryobacterium roopkundense]MBB5643619.1 enoyl-CoA hydratase [Cryobacterium roopkundense]
MTAVEPTEPEVLVRREGTLGHLILNRPRAMNALTHRMMMTIGRQLTDWETDDAVHAVLLTGAGERGLCAGGDIVAIYRDTVAGGTGTSTFWADEYPVNLQIARYPKPFIAMMDGVVLGGGMGVSAHASIRIVTERTKVGMPETAIGFVPDVGGTYLFGRSPGELGTHLALTAGTATGADAIRLGLADRYLASEKVPALVRALGEMTAGSDLQSTLDSFTEAPPAAPLLASQSWIDACYSADTAEQIVANLQQSPEADARATADVILAKSPTAVKVTLESLRRARKLPNLEAVLEQEFRVSIHSLKRPDFREGIRAMVIDKDRTPQWSPPELADVSDAEVASHFDDLGADELRLTALAHPHSN